jgi:uncharacterized protein (TIGR02284 family)
MQEYEPEVKPSFDENQVRETIEELIDVCRDGEQGYGMAADHVRDAGLKDYFRQQSAERGRFAAELEQALEDHLGRWQTTRQGSFGGAARRVWMEAKVVVHAGDHAILESVEGGEDAAKGRYEKALEKEFLPPILRGLVRGQAQAIIAAHDHAKMLRDQRKAA